MNEDRSSETYQYGGSHGEVMLSDKKEEPFLVFLVDCLAEMNSKLTVMENIIQLLEKHDGIVIGSKPQRPMDKADPPVTRRVRHSFQLRLDTIEDLNGRLEVIMERLYGEV